jgi:hypothetical protein
MTAFTLSLALGMAVTAAPTAERAIASAVEPGKRAELVGLRNVSPRGCEPKEWLATKEVDGSGALVLRFTGFDKAHVACDGWAWADLRVFAKVLEVTRPVKEGEALTGAIREKEVAVAQGERFFSTLPDGASATHELRPGSMLTDADIRVGPRPGDPVVVLVRVGAIELSLESHAVTCERGQACALMPGGKRVSGRWQSGHIEVEAP